MQLIFFCVFVFFDVCMCVCVCVCVCARFLLCIAYYSITRIRLRVSSIYSYDTRKDAAEKNDWCQGAQTCKK